MSAVMADVKAIRVDTPLFSTGNVELDKIFNQAFEHAPEDINTILSGYAKKGTYSVTKSGSCHSSGHVELNLSITNGDVYDVARHETGHLVCYLGKGTITGESIRLRLSETELFTKAVKKDRASLKKDIARSKGLYDAFLEKELKQDPLKSGFFNDFTKNRIGGNWGHSNGYINKVGASEKEVFAHLFDGYSTHDKAAYNLMKLHAPETVKAFESIIGELAKLIKTQV